MQQDLLALLRPPSARLERQLSERVRPHLSAVARAHAGRPAPQVLAALAEVVRAAGAEPDLTALAEHAERVSAGEDPYA
ncbi:hypothetical protein [Quadrisphaera sp. DSM 44207]|uniref:hypothetical protein n=1 Tax=Quadrisphaera sp. DSM 44207 TaxID=1881057 RepID=UPI00115F9E47|nr:hypothetical protein [Quadrisphaera sp. DSM 44207]